jgi:hypothetical protein
MNIRISEHNGAPEYAIVRFGEWETTIDRMEELEDIRDARTISAAIAADEEICLHEFPLYRKRGEYSSNGFVRYHERKFSNTDIAAIVSYLVTTGLTSNRRFRSIHHSAGLTSAHLPPKTRCLPRCRSILNILVGGAIIPDFGRISR